MTDIPGIPAGQPDDDAAARVELHLPRAKRDLIVAAVLEAFAEIQAFPDDLGAAARLAPKVLDIGGEAGLFQSLLVMADMYLDHITGGLHGDGVPIVVGGVGYVAHRHGAGGRRVQLDPPNPPVEWMGNLMHARATRDAERFIDEYRRWQRAVIDREDVDDTEDPDAPFLWPILMTMNVALGLVCVPRGAAINAGTAESLERRLGASWN